MLLGGELQIDAKIQILTFLRVPSTWNMGVCNRKICDQCDSKRYLKSWPALWALSPFGLIQPKIKQPFTTTWLEVEEAVGIHRRTGHGGVLAFATWAACFGVILGLASYKIGWGKAKKGRLCKVHHGRSELPVRPWWYLYQTSNL